MDGRQDWSTGDGGGQQVYGHPSPETASAEPRIEPIGEAWATGVGPVAVSAGSRRLRWGIALAVVLCVALVTTAAAFVMVGGAAPSSLTATSAPKNSIMFASLRTDLPGDQHQKLADFMSHFPGFKDRATFDNKLDQFINMESGRLSPDLALDSSIKPWLGNEISVAVTSLGTTAGESGAVIIVALKDRAKADAWVAEQASKAGLTFTSAPYAGTTLHTSSAGGESTAYASTDKVLLLGTTNGVKAALDTKTKGSLDGNANYQAAMKSFSGDRVATFYMDLKALLETEYASVANMGGISKSDIDFALSSVPAWLAGSVRAESNDIVVEMATPRPKGTAATGNHSSALASYLPGSTLSYFEVHSVGKSISKMIGMYGAAGAPASYQAAAKTIRDALTRIGGLDWLGDTAFAIAPDGSSYGGGLVALAPDAKTAGEKAAMLSNLLSLAGSSGIKTRDETYKGTSITVASVQNGSGAPLEFAIASHDRLVVASYGVGFVKAIIDTTSSTSLASKDSFKSIMGVAGDSNNGAAYIDITAIAGEISRSLSGAGAADYNENIKPYVDHLGAVALSSVDGDTLITRLVISAK